MIKQWRLGRLAKAQPSISFPGLKLPAQPGVKTIGTPTQQKLFEQKEGSGWPSVSVKGAEQPAAGIISPGGSAYIKGNLAPERQDSIRAHEAMHQLFHIVGQKHGDHVRRGLAVHLSDKIVPFARGFLEEFLSNHGYDRHHHLHNEELVNYTHTYMTDPENRKKIQQLIPASLRQEVDKHMKTSWKRILDAAGQVSDRDIDRLADIKKAVPQPMFDENIQENTSSHAEHHVDHTFHVEKNPAPEFFKKILSSKKIHMDISSGRSLGIAPKIMFHDVMHKGKKNTLMIKPYHMSAHVDDTESWCPHEYRGWSTMATKSLFDAGGIGHLCEDVSTHVHNNVPVTVHNFDRSALSSGEFHELGKKKPHLTSMFQIGAMDFLTNNLDRHSDNLMVHRDGTPLAIDHERGFQYERTLPDHFEDEGTGFDNIHHYLTRYGPLRKAFNGATVKQGRKAFSELSDWWTKNHIHVKTAMEDQLTAIKDISYRNHIRSNFIARADHLTNVCKKAQANNFDPFTGDDDSDDIRTIPMSERADAGLKSIVEKALPKDNPIMAVNMLADYINGSKALAPKQISTISSVMRDRIAKLTPKQAVELYEHVSENPHFNSPKIKKNREKLDPRFLLLYNIKTKPGSEHAHELSLLAERRLGDHILKNWRRTLVKSLSPKGKG